MPRSPLMSWRLALPLALGALVACSPLTPAPQPPSIALPNQFDTPASSGPAAAALCWRNYFADADLQVLIGQALRHNHDLRSARLRVQEARAAYGIQQAERWPTLGAQAAATRARIPADLNLSRQPLLGNQFQIGVGFNSWELDFWGRVSSLESAALESYLASDAARQALELSVVAQVAQGYLALAELNERLALAERTVSSRAESLRIFKRRVELGATSRLELTQVELLWQQATMLRAQLEQARATQAQALALLVGVNVAQLGPVGALDGAWPELAPGLPAELLTARPDIMAAEHSLRAAQANIAAARAAFLPRVALTSNWSTASAELDGLFKNGSADWAFSPSISLPIFDGGRREAALTLAQVRSEQAVVRYEQTIQAAFRDVADALTARHWLGEQVQTLRATQAVQTERARLAKLRYDSGAARYLEVLDAERDLLTVQQQRVQAQRALLSAHVALYAALGGGSQFLHSTAASPAPAHSGCPTEPTRESP